MGKTRNKASWAQKQAILIPVGRLRWGRHGFDGIDAAKLTSRAVWPPLLDTQTTTAKNIGVAARKNNVISFPVTTGAAFALPLAA